jgi:hypothetical protein
MPHLNNDKSLVEGLFELWQEMSGNDMILLSDWAEEHVVGKSDTELLALQADWLKKFEIIQEVRSRGGLVTGWTFDGAPIVEYDGDEDEELD